MSWLLLVFGAWCALHAFNAWRPVRRNRVLFAWSFFAAWLTIEAAPFWLVIELIVGALLVWGGALDHIVGWIGLGLLVAAWLDQVVLIVQGRAATATAVQAFGDFGRDVLGDRAAIPTEKVVVERNIEFRRVAGKRLRLDVYRPASDGQRRPAVLQIHGGAWVIGDKREQGIPLLRHLASHGWVGFNVNYRLSPGATFPDHLVDVKAALAWIRGHADDYGIDPDFVVVTGGSAGGHLTALMGLTANDARYQPGFEHADTSVQAAVPFYGIYDFTNRGATMAPQFHRWIAEPLVIKAFLDEEPERFADASPLDHIRPDAPPFLVIHGDNDTLAPVEDARAFVAQLSAVSSSPVVYVELHGAQHAFDVFRSPRTRRMVRAVEQFLFVVHLGHTGAAPAPPEAEPETSSSAHPPARPDPPVGAGSVDDRQPVPASTRPGSTAS
jgi:acetyl esterase/lipase